MRHRKPRMGCALLAMFAFVGLSQQPEQQAPSLTITDNDPGGFDEEGKFFGFTDKNADVVFGPDWDGAMFEIEADNERHGKIQVWKNNTNCGMSCGKFVNNAEEGDWDEGAQLIVVPGTTDFLLDEADLGRLDVQYDAPTKDVLFDAEKKSVFFDIGSYEVNYVVEGHQDKGVTTVNDSRALEDASRELTAQSQAPDGTQPPKQSNDDEDEDLYLLLDEQTIGGVEVLFDGQDDDLRYNPKKKSVSFKVGSYEVNYVNQNPVMPKTVGDNNDSDDDDRRELELERYDN